MRQSLGLWASSVLLVLPLACFAQEDRVVLEPSQVPIAAAAVNDFTPSGWVVEEAVSGDLNGDSVPDVALKLVQEKRAGVAEDEIVERARALVILLKGNDGKLHRAAVAGRLLQCTACGGAFYGVVEAPANVTIEKGVLLVRQDFGSRNVVEQTFRFRQDPKDGQFVLIGCDIVDRDRATGTVIDASTNFLTGQKIVKTTVVNERTQKETTKTSKQTVAKERRSIEEIDYEEPVE